MFVDVNYLTAIKAKTFLLTLKTFRFRRAPTSRFLVLNQTSNVRELNFRNAYRVERILGMGGFEFQKVLLFSWRLMALENICGFMENTTRGISLEKLICSFYQDEFYENIFTSHLSKWKDIEVINIANTRWNAIFTLYYGFYLHRKCIVNIYLIKNDAMRRKKKTWAFKVA